MPGRRLAWNRSGANLVSGIASTLLAEREAELGLLEVDEGALPEVVRRVLVADGHHGREELPDLAHQQLVALRRGQPNHLEPIGAPPDDVHASAALRRHLARVLVGRALAAIVETR